MCAKATLGLHNHGARCPSKPGNSCQITPKSQNTETTSSSGSSAAKKKNLHEQVNEFLRPRPAIFCYFRLWQTIENTGASGGGREQAREGELQTFAQIGHIMIMTTTLPDGRLPRIVIGRAPVASAKKSKLRLFGGTPSTSLQELKTEDHHTLSFRLRSRKRRRTHDPPYTVHVTAPPDLVRLKCSKRSPRGYVMQ